MSYLVSILTRMGKGYETYINIHLVATSIYAEKNIESELCALKYHLWISEAYLSTHDKSLPFMWW